MSVNEKEILTHLHHGAHVFNVEIEGSNAETCLVKDLQFGYLGDNVIHVDLTRVNLDEEAANLVRFQQAYQAAAQLLTVVDSLFQTILSTLRT